MNRNWMGWGIGGLAVLAGLIAPPPAKALPPLTTETMCAAEVGGAERRYGIPADLLHAISIVESGRYDSGRRASLAWPWTVMAEGQGRFFPTKAEAIAEVRRLQARGVRNIDVGCMQVNLRHHPTAFASLDEAFDPAANVGYAARFLKGLFDATGHWPTAASYYHSQTPRLAAAYREKLMRVWARATSDETPRLAAVTAVPGPVSRRPPAPATETRTAPARSQAEAEREEAGRIAAAYRLARVEEYQLRRIRFQEARAALASLSRR